VIPWEHAPSNVRGAADGGGMSVIVGSAMAMSFTEPRPGLRGRRVECGVLEGLLEQARAGLSGVLVLRGEAGVGKTALLDHLADQAAGARIERVAGVETEIELPFAGLHQLCRSMAADLERLPGEQRAALRTAFGLDVGEPPDRFQVGLGVLGLLAESAATAPVACLVDDAQWLDRASRQCLAFAVRRLHGEGVAVVLAIREPADDDEFRGLPELRIGGLTDDVGRALLRSTFPVPIDEQVLDRVVAEARGNPLALRELAAGMTPADLAGGFALTDVDTPLANRIEQRYVGQVELLPAETRRLLLVAALEPVGDAALLWRATAQLGIAADAVGPAQAAGLIEVGLRVRFRHPLVRSAVRRAADHRDRRAAHGALAAVSDPDRDPDRRAWHLAHSVDGPDEAVAAELERSAGRARDRGGDAAAAAFLERAAALTPDSGRRGARSVDAAYASYYATAVPTLALELLAIAERCPLDALQLARLERLRAQISFTVPQLLAAARGLEPLDPALARDTYLDAFAAAVYVGRVDGGSGEREAARAGLQAPVAPDPPRALDLLLDGLATRAVEGLPAGVDLLRRAVEAFSLDGRRADEDVEWLFLVTPVSRELWDDDRWDRLSARAVRLTRSAGALSSLPTVLMERVLFEVQAGEFAKASVLRDEARVVEQWADTFAERYAGSILAAWTGREADASELIRRTVATASEMGEGISLAVADYAHAVLANGLGRYEEAVVAAQRACAHDDLGLVGWSLGELVEAAVRSGSQEIAGSALERLAERTAGAGTEWALGTLARARALCATDDEVESLHREAVERLGRTRMPLHTARAHLVYGEWLRRENRRVDARAQLRIAYDTFADAGAEAFAERSRRELAATGETVRKRDVDTRVDLTPQELQVARLASQGCTNAEIAGELFISARTVEWHLRKVFTKLGISSRRELANAIEPRRGSLAAG
jgi:DNA-binding CsgD family transcriptional regulator